MTSGGMGLFNMRRSPIVILSAALSILLVFSVAPALAATAEITANTLAWYGQDQFSREEKDPLGQTHIIESPNPFCPAVPGSLGNVPGACADGRLPIEVRGGNYEPKEQNKISAVGFDMSLIPLGSKVNKFTATFLEAKAGCYKSEESQDDPKPVEHCEETDPVNVEGHELQACFIDGFLTEGQGRPMSEAPRFTCSDSDPVAKRKEVKTKGGETWHTWTFDLTAFAKTWIEELTPTPSVMLIGKAPKGDAGPDETWRVVLTGPKFEAGNIPGLETEISYIPGKTPMFPPLGGGNTGGTGGTIGGFGTTGGTDFGSSSTGTTDFGSSGTSSGTGTTSTPSDTGAEAEEAAEAEEPPALAVGGAETDGPGMPGYVWLAILAGIMAFSMVRSVVLDSASGIRPNGVLAQIQRLNADRHGAAAAGAASGASVFAPVTRAFAGIKEKAGSLGDKLNFRKKG